MLGEKPGTLKMRFIPSPMETMYLSLVMTVNDHAFRILQTQLAK